MYPIHSLSNSLPTALFSNVQENVQNMGSHIVSKLNPRNILKAGAVVAPVFVALEMLSSVPAADAGFACFAACMSLCAGATAGAMTHACIPACLIACSTNPI